MKTLRILPYAAYFAIASRLVKSDADAADNTRLNP
jgi:hypothetical protein